MEQIRNAGSEVEKAKSAMILMHLAEYEPNRKEIAKSGGGPALVDLLSSDDKLARENAARALGFVAMDAENKDAIIKAGGIDKLKQMKGDVQAEASLSILELHTEL